MVISIKKINQITSNYKEILETHNKKVRENLIQLWEIDKIYAKIELKDPNIIIKVKPMRYVQNDRQ